LKNELHPIKPLIVVVLTINNHIMLWGLPFLNIFSG